MTLVFCRSVISFPGLPCLVPGAVGAHPISEYGGIPVLRLDAEAQDFIPRVAEGP
jgi:hypothetical protein